MPSKPIQGCLIPDVNLNKMDVKKIRDYQFSIATGDTEPVLKELSQMESPLKKEFLLLMNRFNRIHHDKLKGIVSLSEYDINLNQINSSLLNYLELLELSADKKENPANRPIKKAKQQDDKKKLQDLLLLERIEGNLALEEKIRNTDQVLIGFEETEDIIQKNLYNSLFQSINKMRIYANYQDPNILTHINEDIEKILVAMTKYGILVYGIKYNTSSLESLTNEEKQKFQEIINKEFNKDADDDESGADALVTAIIGFFLGGWLWAILAPILGGVAIELFKNVKTVVLIKIVHEKNDKINADKRKYVLK